jgi:hypothetical protein
MEEVEMMEVLPEKKGCDGYVGGYLIVGRYV